MTFEKCDMRSENQPRSHRKKTHQFALAGPARISANKGKERNKHRGVEIIYTIQYPHKSRYTSNRRYAIRNRKPQKEKRKEKKKRKKKLEGKLKERRVGVIFVISSLGHGSRGHAKVRAHETWWGNSHLRRSSNSIDLSRGRWGGCVCRNACGELFEGGKLRWKTW